MPDKLRGNDKYLLNYVKYMFIYYIYTHILRYLDINVFIIQQQCQKVKAKSTITVTVTVTMANFPS